MTKKALKYFLVLDDKPMELKQVTLFLKALDYLFQSYFVFNVRYPLGWRNTFTFLQTHFYKIFEPSSSQCTRQITISGSGYELWTRLNLGLH
jgi:hypothetical protein